MKRTYTNWKDAASAIKAAEALDMDYTLTKQTKQTLITVAGMATTYTMWTLEIKVGDSECPANNE